ncbi:MAG: hypothetical protein QXX19_07305, partial [Candidatus Caldarchaeum sp.]
RDFINAAASRSALDRCLHRHGVRNLKARLAEEDTPKQIKTFKTVSHTASSASADQRHGRAFPRAYQRGAGDLPLSGR